MSIETVDTPLGFKVTKRVSAEGEMNLRVDYMRLSVYVSKVFDLEPDRLFWRAAEVSFASRGSCSVQATQEHVCAIMYACSLASALDAEHPAGTTVRLQAAAA